MTAANQAFIAKAIAAATQAPHIWPAMAAAEAALESAHLTLQGTVFGGSQLALNSNNLFGMKAHANNTFGAINLPTKEYSSVKGWYTIEASWEVYPDWASCFKDRMDTLERLEGTYPHYAAALAATDPITYVEQVSLTWSTGPKRAQSVIDIYNEYCK